MGSTSPSTTRAQGNDFCNAGNNGQIRTYRVSDGQFMSQYMIPRSQGGSYCSVHNGTYIPVAGRYLPGRRLVRRRDERDRPDESDEPA